MAPGRHSTDRAWPGDSQTLCCPHGAGGPLGEIRAWLGGGGVLTLGSRGGREGVQEGVAGPTAGLSAGPHGPSGFKSHPSCPVSGPSPFPTDQSTFVITTRLSTHTHTHTHTHRGQQVCTGRPGEARATLPEPTQGPHPWVPRGSALSCDDSAPGGDWGLTLGGGLPDCPAWALGYLWDCPGRGRSRDVPSTARPSSVSPGHSRNPGQIGGERAQGLGETGSSPHRTGQGPGGLCPGPQPVPGGLVTWGAGFSLQGVKSPGRSAALDCGAGSHVESPTARAVHSCPNLVVRSPETGWRWGRQAPERRGTGQREEEAGGLEREGRWRGCIPTRAVLLAGGPRPGPSAAPPCTPWPVPSRPASPAPLPGQGA